MTSGFRRSRCEFPQDPPLRWVYYRLPGQAPRESPVGAALRSAGISPSGLPDAVLRFAEFESVLNRAAAGQLVQSEDDEIKPVTQNPHLWELRFTFGGHGYRLYFGEPQAAPAYIVALHFHAKTVVHGDPAATRRLQNEEIAAAVARFDEGESNKWAILT